MEVGFKGTVELVRLREGQVRRPQWVVRSRLNMTADIEPIDAIITGLVDQEKQRDRQLPPVSEIVLFGVEPEGGICFRANVALPGLDLRAYDLARWEFTQCDLDRAVHADVFFEEIAPDEIEPIAGLFD